MKRHARFTIQKFMILLFIISSITMVLSWEMRQTLAPIEQSINYVVIPFQKGATYFGDWVKGKVTSIQNIRELEEMNTYLMEEVDQLRYKNKLLELDKVELERLRGLYDLDQQYADYPKTGARVIGKDPGNWYEVFVIDKGSDDGIEPNMIVMAGSGLVGRIIDVQPNSSRVRSIIDDTSSVSAKIVRTSDIATVSGDKKLGDKGLCLIEDIHEDVNITEGDEIVTSHLGNYFPPGILIGYVKSIESNPNKLTKTAILEPVVDFKHLEEVLVINLKPKD